METNTAENMAHGQTFSPLPTTREERGRQIAQRGGIRQIGTQYAVPSQTPGSATLSYMVDIVAQSCTCPDYELRRSACKHQEAVLFWLAWEGSVNAEKQAEASAAAPKKRKTYRQNWPAYNAAQTTEKARVEMLLKSLCEGIEEPAPDPRGAVRPFRFGTRSFRRS